MKLLDLNRHIRRVLALNFEEALWVTAELAQLSQARGHYYLSLVQKAEAGEAILAQAEARLWAGDYRRLQAQSSKQLASLLQPGLELKLLVLPVFHERYGLSLTIRDIDPQHTEGRLQAARRESMLRLQADGLLNANNDLALPLVPQRLAVVSAEGAAGYADFRRQLSESAAKYAFSIKLFTAAMQGPQAAVEITSRLRQLARRAAKFDVVIILRGGGSRMDLLAFDDESLCRAVAESPLPVWSAVGHETDQSLLDMVAHTALKTPTAAAVFLLDRMAFFESSLLELYDRFLQLADREMRIQQQQLKLMESRLLQAAQSKLSYHRQQLDFADKRLLLAARQQIVQARQELDRQSGLLQALDPAVILARGYALVSQNGRLVKKAGDFDPLRATTIRWIDGEQKLEKDPASNDSTA